MFGGFSLLNTVLRKAGGMKAARTSWALRPCLAAIMKMASLRKLAKISTTGLYRAEARTWEDVAPYIQSQVITALISAGTSILWWRRP